MELDRYSRQIIFPGIGQQGQKKLAESQVVVIGCGALGCFSASSLVRAGVGRIRIVDRDFIEYHNLQRQILFDEEDVKNQLPKAIAAEQHLKKINSSVDIQGIVADVNYANIEKFIAGADVVLDGLDNLETRYLINDACLKHDIRWVYGGAIASRGMTMNIIPGQSPCLRCVSPNIPSQGTILTCDTGGVINPAVFMVASLQSVETLKMLVGAEDINRDIIYLDVWKGTFNRFQASRDPDCPACHGKYEFLQTWSGTRATVLCGQDAVQVLNPKTNKVYFPAIAKRLERLGQVSYNEFMLRFEVEGHQMVLFPDGRAIVKGTSDESLAKGLYAKYVGS